MTNPPLEELDDYSGNDSFDTTQVLRKRDKFRNFFTVPKSESKVKDTSSTQSLTSQQSIPSSIASQLNKIQDKSLAVVPAEEYLHMNIFPENIGIPTIRTDLPHPQQRIERTVQLLYCNTLLLQNSSTLLSTAEEPIFNQTEQKWLAEIKEDPMEQDRLQWLVTRMAEAFIENSNKDSTKIAEIVALGPVLPRESYRMLLSSLITDFDECRILDVGLLQGLVQLVQGASSGFLVPDDLVKILSILRVRLQGTQQESSEHTYYLTQAVSRVLDVMADHKVQDLSRVLEHEPLSAVLSGLNSTSDPYLIYQACYAFQALQYVSDDETVLQAVLRQSNGVVDGLVKMSAVVKLDVRSVLEGLEQMQQVAVGAIGTAGTIYKGVSSLRESGRGVFESLKEGFGSGQKRTWYSAVRAAYAFVQAGHLKDLKKLIYEAPCRCDALFQWGICQLLGEIAVDTVWTLTTRQQAVDLLGHLYRNDQDWGRDEGVKECMVTVLDSLGSVFDQAFNKHALELLQELDLDSTPRSQSFYPLRSLFLIPCSSQILDKIQEVPYLEYELYKLRLQRLEEEQQTVYIPPQAKPFFHANDDELFPLMEKVQEFLVSDRQVMLILGDSGAGKSTFNRHLEHQLWTEYKRGGPIPLFINLAAIDEPQHDMVTKQLQFHNLSNEQIQELKLHRQIVLICDGYDESQQLLNLHRTNFLNQPTQWNTKMVITCRSQYLGPSYRDRFKPQPLDRYNTGQQDLFQEAVIAPFSNEQIRSYVDQFVRDPNTRRVFDEGAAWSSEEHIERLRAIPNLMDLVKNPFLLTLALSTLPRLVGSQQDLSSLRITRVILYDKFVEQWLETNKLRLQTNTLSKEEQDVFELLLDDGFIASGIDFQKRLSDSIFKEQEGNPVVGYTHLRDKQTWKVEFFSPDPQVRLLRESCPLTRTGSQFRFVHRSVLEYFLSCVIYSPVNHENEFDPQDNSDSTAIQTFETSGPLFTRNLLKELSIIQFLCDRVQNNPGFKHQLLAVINQSKTDALAATAAANAITILIRSGVHFNCTDLRGVKIPNADLTDGQFDSVQFHGADLRGVNFTRCWLRKVDFGDAQMKSVRFGELPYLEVDDTIWACAYSPDGKVLALSISDGKIDMLDTATWKVVGTLKGHDDYIGSVEFSTDGQRIVSGSADKTVRLWDIVSSENPLLIMEGHAATVNSVAFSPCGKHVASASDDKTVRVWSTETGTCLFVLNGHEDDVNGVEYSPDGHRIVSCGSDGTIRLWDPATGELDTVWISALGGIQCLDFSPDGLRIASGHFEGNVQLWSTVSGEPGLVFSGQERNISGIAFSPNSQQVVASSHDSTLRIWDVSTGALISVLTGHSRDIQGVVFSPDGQQIVSGGGDRKLRLWEVNSGELSLKARGHSDVLAEVVYSPDGRSVFSSSVDGTVRQWDSDTGTAVGPILFQISESIQAITFSPVGQQVATSSEDSVIRLWNFPYDSPTGSPMLLQAHKREVFGLNYSPCGRWLLTRSFDNTALLWDSRNPEEKPHRLTRDKDGEVDDNTAHCAVFSPTGHQIIVGYYGGLVCLFDAQTKVLLRSITLESNTSPQLAIGAGNGKIYLWDLQSNEPGTKLRVDDAVFSVAYSPCGRWIASGSRTKTVRLWRRQHRVDSDEEEAWLCVAVLKDFFGHIHHITWNPVGQALEFVTGCDDRSIRMWRVFVDDDFDGDVRVGLRWSSHVGRLCVSNLKFGETVDLSDTCQRLLLQRGAVGDDTSSEEDENYSSSDYDDDDEEEETDEDDDEGSDDDEDEESDDSTSQKSESQSESR
ncbi:hypothetical protein BGZ97_000321 [Linnemannia gamsii]|uniref:WD40 repeat-like protein n=1 Tax=Linnemannia gamsii TaxID=64522 RepID=A0A9P6UK59_9FUNG|nr:hypothetical protein BGZ97_000321 [Linnemannia gamsii]